MKSFILLAFTIFYSAFIAYFYANRITLHTKINDYITPYYSTLNKRITTTVLKQKAKKSTSNNETIPIPNTEYIYSPGNFQIDDTEPLSKLDLSCRPDSFGYSISKGEQVFPPFQYPNCSDETEQPDTYLHIDREKNILYMDCPDGSNNKYVSGPNNDKKLIKRDEKADDWHIRDYDEPVNASKIEFGLGSCEKDGENMIQGYMNPIFKKEAYEKAKEKVQGKPKIVYFLTLDSLSRRHFFRKLPKVIDYLNELNLDPEFSVFDFKLHNNQGETSPKNQEPIFSGKTNYPTFKKKNKDKDMLGDMALWNKLREKGYINMLAFEDCDGSFVNYIGRYPNVEYTVNQFYCAVELYAGISFRKEGGVEHRCLGGHMSHYYILNYTDNVVDMNKGVNIMLYNHLSAGHEYTGQHAGTLNEDIEIYLRNFIKKYRDDFELLIFLQADHGMRYGNFFKDPDAYQENKLPAFFLIASTSILERFPYSYHTLYTNTLRLTSKIDYRKTVLDLEGIIEENPWNVNLMTQIASKSRQCDDLGILNTDCSCLALIEINNTSSEVEFFINSLKNYAENIINSQVYGSSTYPLGKICKKITLDRISKIYHTGVNNVREIFKLEIESDTQKNMKFQITYLVVSDGVGAEIKRERYRTENFSYLSYQMKSRVRVI